MMCSHNPSSRADLVCAVFSNVQTMVQLSVLGIFNMDTDKNAYDCTDELLYKCTNSIRKSALNVDWETNSLAIPGRGTCIGSARGLALNHLSYALPVSVLFYVC